MPARNAKMANNQKGLTLIEVLIAIALFAFISMAIYSVTTRSFAINFSLGNESNDYMNIALSIQAVESDISQIYTPLITTQNKPQDAGNDQPSDFWSVKIRSDGIRRARIKGTREKLTFIANNNRRVERDSPQSDFLKITWEIEQNKTGAYTLYRSTDWDAFRLEDRTGKTPLKIALLENMSSAKFSYYRRSNKTWEETWESEGVYVKAEERYPDLISLKFEAPDPTNNATQQSWEVIMKPNSPLNYIDPAKKAQQKNAGFLE